MKKIVFLFVLVSILAMGCTQHLGNFTAMSSSNYDPKKIDNDHLVAANVTGNTSSLIIFGIPIGGAPKVDQAVAEALATNKGDFMQNCSLYYYAWSAFVVGKIGYKVKGDVYNTKK